MSKYKARKGATFTDEKANIYGACIEKIGAVKGYVASKDIVAEALSVSSPLHEYFDWDNDSAADKYRLQQARYLMNHLIIEVTINGKTKDQSAFFNVDIDVKEGEQGYLSLGKALSIKVYRDQVLTTALREHDYWENKYSNLKELSLIFIAGKKVKQKLAKKIGKP